jgi:hypothetical protein
MAADDLPPRNNRSYFMKALQSKTNASGSNVQDPAPPAAALAPTQQLATTTRMLLHNANAQFESTCKKLEEFTDSVENTRREVVTVGKAFNDQHDRLVDEMVNLSACRLLPTRIYARSSAIEHLAT